MQVMLLVPSESGAPAKKSIQISKCVTLYGDRNHGTRWKLFITGSDAHWLLLGNLFVAELQGNLFRWFLPILYP